MYLNAFIFLSSCFNVTFWWTIHQVTNYSSFTETSQRPTIFQRDDTNCVHLNSVSVMPILNDTEVLFLPIVSSPLFSVFGLNPKGPEAFSDV